MIAATGLSYRRPSSSRRQGDMEMLIFSVWLRILLITQVRSTSKRARIISTRELQGVRSCHLRHKQQVTNSQLNHSFGSSLISSKCALINTKTPLVPIQEFLGRLRAQNTHHQRFNTKMLLNTAGV
jgi:hypothetical protein